MADTVRPAPLDEETAKLLSKHLKGITSVTLRIVGSDAFDEASVRTYLQSRGILVDVIHLGQILPPPLRRFSFQYEGRRAVITMTPSAKLSG